MKIIGIVAEYNPFHNGHKYHIEKVKEMYPDSLIILVINGYFTQRGIISVLSKEDKVKIALDNDVDLVLELPFVFGTQASDIFAYNSIKILNNFKIDTLVFGSESNDVELLKKIVDIQLNDPTYEGLVKEYLQQGLNYPTAMKKALNIEEDFNNPNDLLGISYIKAINKINSNIKPVTIKRTNSYLDTNDNSDIISATNIRNRLSLNEDISQYIPNYDINLINNINNENFFNLLKFKILTTDDLSIYLDVDEGIEYRILDVINDSNSFNELVNNIKTKRYTYNRICRMLIHILIGLSKKDINNIKLDYIKILGFSNKGQQYLKDIRDILSIPTIINKDSIIYKYELKAAYLYSEIIKKDISFDKKNIPIKK